MAQLVGLFKIDSASTRAFYTLGNVVLNRDTEVSVNLHELSNDALENLIASLENDVISSSDTTAEEIRGLINNTTLDVSSISVTNVTIDAIEAGDNNIGNVDIVSMPDVVITELPAGNNNIGNVDIVTMPSLPAGTNNIGDVDVLTLPDIVVSELPELPAGNNNIGNVDIVTMPNVVVATLPSLPAGTNNIGDVDVLTLPTVTINSIPAGTNNIGDVDVLTLPAIPTGSNVIGKVDSVGLFNVRPWSQFYNLRGQRFIATTGYIQNPLNAASTIALFRNPSGSGKWIFFDQAEFGATNNTRFSRLGGGSFNITGGPNTLPIARTDGGTPASSVALIYKGGNSSPEFSVTTPGALRKVATMLAYDSYQLLSMNGTAILRPGQDAYWIVDEAIGGGGGNFNTFIDFEWVEIDETVAGNMVTALAAHSEF